NSAGGARATSFAGTTRWNRIDDQNVCAGALRRGNIQRNRASSIGISYGPGIGDCGSASNWINACHGAEPEVWLRVGIRRQLRDEGAWVAGKSSLKSAGCFGEVGGSDLAGQVDGFIRRIQGE